MAENENPFAKYKQPSAGENPFAKYKKEEEPGVLEDMAKVAGPALLRGSVAAITAPRAVSDLTGAGVNWLANKVAPKSVADAANKFHNTDFGVGKAFPSYDETIGDLQKEVTGPLYEAKRGPGKAADVAISALPALAAGGEGLIPAAAKAVGSGVGSELLGEAANKIKGWFPKSVPDWAEPVARGVGAIAGTGLPAATRRAATPLPMTDQRLATVNALRATNPELVNASSAGQLTERPGLMSLEGRSSRMADLPERQAEGYTRGVMRQAGSDGLFDSPGLAQAASRGEDLRLLQNAHQMSPTEFSLLNQDVRGITRPGSPLFRAVGPSDAVRGVADQIKFGPMGPTGKNPPLNMTGERYGAMKQIAQSAGEAAPTTHEANAIFNIRDNMKTRFQNSMPPDEADRLRGLDRQYSNYKTIEGIPRNADQTTVTPDAVFKRASPGSDLETHATQAKGVMTPLPEPSTEAGTGTKIIGGLLGGLGGGGAGLAAHSPAEAVGAGLFGSYYGMNHLNDIIQGVKNAAGSIAGHPVSQAYLKNQRWRPDAYTSAPDISTLARILASPSEVPQLTSQK